MSISSQRGDLAIGALYSAATGSTWSITASAASHRRASRGTLPSPDSADNCWYFSLISVLQMRRTGRGDVLTPLPD